MPSRTVKIEEMRLRVSGLSTEQGHRLGAAVAQQLAGKVSSCTHFRNHGTLNLKLAVSTKKTPDSLASSIAEAVIARIG